MLQRLEKEQLPRFMKSMFYITMYNSMTSRGAYELPEQVHLACHVCVTKYISYGEIFSLQLRVVKRMVGSMYQVTFDL
jgi:hypothetical protein